MDKLQICQRLFERTASFFDTSILIILSMDAFNIAKNHSNL